MSRFESNSLRIIKPKSEEANKQLFVLCSVLTRHMAAGFAQQGGKLPDGEEEGNNTIP